MLEYLRHILLETNYVLKTSKNLTKKQFLNDETLTRAFIRSIEIIGEATKKISPELRIKYPTVNWKEMAGTRDKLIHDYLGVDYDIVWDIVENELPNLKIEIEHILSIES